MILVTKPFGNTPATGAGDMHNRYPVYQTKANADAALIEPRI
jgi:hypothetical protein